MSIRRHTLFNLVGAIIPMFVLLITVPLYLNILGDVRYGVLALVWLILGYFGFLEMGLGKATANHIARLQDSTAQERGDIFWTALSVNAAFGMFAALFFWGIGSYLLTSVLKIPIGFQGEVLAALPWMVATLPLTLVSSVLNGALEGSNKFLVVNGLQVTSTVVFQVFPLFIAYTYSPSLIVVIPAALLSRGLMNVFFLVACFRYVPLGPRPTFSIIAAKSLLSFGGWVAISGMIIPLLSTIDRFFIGIILGAQSVTFYTVPSQLVNKASVIPGSLCRALFPRFSAHKPEDADKIAIKSLVALLVIITPIVIGGMLFLNPFMSVWIGGDMASIASSLGEIFFIGVWINALGHIPYFLLQGKGEPDVAAKIHLFQLIPYILFLWVALKVWGIYAAWIWSFRFLIDALLLFRFSGLSAQVMSMLVSPGVMVVSALFSAQYIAGENWVWRVVLALLYAVWMVFWFKKNQKVGLLTDFFLFRKFRNNFEIIK